MVHLARVFFTGAFRRPREANWVIGSLLLILAMFEGFFGYSLPDDLLSGTGLRAAFSGITIGVPVVGTWLRSEEHTSELQSRENLVCRLLLEKKKEIKIK